VNLSIYLSVCPAGQHTSFLCAGNDAAHLGPLLCVASSSVKRSLSPIAYSHSGYQKSCVEYVHVLSPRLQPCITSTVTPQGKAGCH